MKGKNALMTKEEIIERYRKGEDPFDLVVEKWVRIEDFLGLAFSREDFIDILTAIHVPIPFCMEYGVRGECFKCPIVKICVPEEEGKESFWSALCRLIQAYAWAGDFLSQEPLRRIVGEFVETLKSYRCDVRH